MRKWNLQNYLGCSKVAEIGRSKRFSTAPDFWCSGSEHVVTVNYSQEWSSNRMLKSIPLIYPYQSTCSIIIINLHYVTFHSIHIIPIFWYFLFMTSKSTLIINRKHKIFVSRRCTVTALFKISIYRAHLNKGNDPLCKMQKENDLFRMEIKLNQQSQIEWESKFIAVNHNFWTIMLIYTICSTGSGRWGIW